MKMDYWLEGLSFPVISLTSIFDIVAKYNKALVLEWFSYKCCMQSIVYYWQKCIAYVEK